MNADTGLKIKDLCDMMHISYKTAWDIVQSGAIKFSRIGRLIIIRPEAVRDYMIREGRHRQWSHWYSSRVSSHTKKN